MKNNGINESSLPITDILLVSSSLMLFLFKKDELALSLKDPTEGPF